MKGTLFLLLFIATDEAVGPSSDMVTIIQSDDMIYSKLMEYNKILFSSFIEVDYDYLSDYLSSMVMFITLCFIQKFNPTFYYYV